MKESNKEVKQTIISMCNAHKEIRDISTILNALTNKASFQTPSTEIGNFYSTLEMQTDYQNTSDTTTISDTYAETIDNGTRKEDIRGNAEGKRNTGSSDK